MRELPQDLGQRGWAMAFARRMGPDVFDRAHEVDGLRIGLSQRFDVEGRAMFVRPPLKAAFAQKWQDTV